jgi:hypothetical protein
MSGTRGRAIILEMIFCNVVDDANGHIVGDILTPSFLCKILMLVELSDVEATRELHPRS